MFGWIRRDIQETRLEERVNRMNFSQSSTLLVEALTTHRERLFDLTVGEVLAVPEGYAVQRYGIVVSPKLPLQASKLRGLALLAVEVPHLLEFMYGGKECSLVQNLKTLVGVGGFETRLEMYRAAKSYKEAAVAGKYVRQLPSGLIITMGKS